MVKQSIDAKVRPLSNTSLEKASLLGAARLYVSKDTLISLTSSLDSGRACCVERLLAEGEDGKETLKREASLWVLPEKNLSPNVVMMTRAFQDATGFKIGDQVRVSLAEGNGNGTTADAGEIVVKDVSEAAQEDPADFKYPVQWEPSISRALGRADLIFPGMVLEGVAVDKLRRSFKVISVDSQQHNLGRFKLASTLIKILNPGDDESADHAGAVNGEQFGGELKITRIPGLTKQTDEVNDFLRGFRGPFRLAEESESCGLVIHGGRGTGKTFILQHLAATNWGKVHWIKPSDKLSTIKEIFKQAQSQMPSMVLIDALDELIVKDRSNRDAVIDALCDELDTLSSIALTQSELPKMLIVATCMDYMTDVPAKLQTESRFNENISLPIPRGEQRLEILRYLDPPLRPEEKDAILVTLSQKTHAYNPRDLRTLVRRAKKVFNKRIDESGLDNEESRPEKWFLEREDMDHALTSTRPTAMHDINLQPPTIHWQDVGGQESLKKILNRMIKNTKNTSLDARKALQHPPKGLLLYGPPGCSKTLSAQALATESSFNFFAVKGAELLNMYVGESERAVRILFERARAASPSIIFFDEIDSIGGQRTGSPNGGGASRSTGSVNMLTTLLNEMDGFEVLTGVLILAATNRPEAIDPALMRPGRFDQRLYVGPPDKTAREAVFGVHLRGLSVSEDVDISALAEKTDGYSGAEIKAICVQAGMAVLDRCDEDETQEIVIRMTDLTSAIERTPRNITPAMIQGYERWSKQFTP